MVKPNTFPHEATADYVLYLPTVDETLLRFNSGGRKVLLPSVTLACVQPRLLTETVI